MALISSNLTQRKVTVSMGETTPEGQQLHLRWHSHSTTFTGMLSELHHGRAYTDVSLVCDGGIVRAHRAILSLCSPYLAVVLAACPDTDAPLLLPDVPVQDMVYLVSFIYRGQVDVHQQHIASFLNTAKHLHVLGLEEGDRLVDSSPSKSDTSTSGSEAGDDISQVINGNNNNEEEELVEEEEEEEDGTTEHGQAVNVKAEFTVKEEPLETAEASADVTADITPDGRIDLNFYLQQAIQSASMPCPLCKKEFKSQSGLRDHIRLHTGERPFECEFCQMNFARASHLKRHRRMHTGEKPFMCRICGKDFSRGDKLKDHLRRHEAEDKLSQIRKQIYQPDEGNAEQPETEMGSQVGSVSNVQVLANKTNSAPTDSIMPPAKRARGRPPKNSQVNSHFQPAVSQVPSALVSQSESYMPHMLGVTSIGECILRPIN
ncbi:zinc finger protein Xfin-like isoform X3 [Macrobrachium nipponense]|uniref:zinc finger protein Xfin-like isoform X3 n=1 Tax=Macrobrachium nipponense TaxID=159736 RepID=UPI0030C8C7A4